MNRGKPNWEHLNEELHVLITVDDTKERAELKLKKACEEIKKLLVPTVSHVPHRFIAKPRKTLADKSGIAFLVIFLTRQTICCNTLIFRDGFINKAPSNGMDGSTFDVAFVMFIPFYKAPPPLLLSVLFFTSSLHL